MGLNKGRSGDVVTEKVLTNKIFEHNKQVAEILSGKKDKLPKSIKKERRKLKGLARKILGLNKEEIKNVFSIKYIKEFETTNAYY